MKIPYQTLLNSPLPTYRHEGVMVSQADFYAFVCPSIRKLVILETKVLREYIETQKPMCATFGKSIGALVPLAQVQTRATYDFDQYSNDLVAGINTESKDTDKSKVAESIFNHFCPHAVANHKQPQDNWDFVLTGKVSGKEYKVEVKWDSKGGNPNLYCELYTQPKTWQERQALFG